MVNDSNGDDEMADHDDTTSTPLRVLVGRRIRHLRKRAGLTQQELGAQADVEYKYLGAVERGERNPTLDVLERVARGLDAPAYRLFLFEEDDEVDEVQVDRERLRDLLDDFEPEDLPRVMAVLRAVQGLLDGR